jgi:glycosyltransferase involved in cell wall biosynthesis
MRRYRDEFTDVVIHVHAPARQGVVVPLLRVLGYRTLVHSHSAAWSSYRYTNIFKRVSLWIASVSASQLVACSNEAAKFAFGGRACAQVDNPVDLKRFKFSDVHRYRIRNTHGISGSLVFGYVGRLSQVKNLDVLIVACADMLKRNRRVMLVIVGDGPERAPLKKLALDLDISRNVIFTGEVAQPGHYYSAIDVFCLPSTAEGFGTSLVEAQASGLRCVVSASMTRAACATDLVRFVQDQSNPLAWTRVLSEIDDLPPCYSADRLSTYGGLERFSAPKISQRMLKLYGWEPRPGNTVRYGK